MAKFSMRANALPTACFAVIAADAVAAESTASGHTHRAADTPPAVFALLLFDPKASLVLTFTWLGLAAASSAVTSVSLVGADL